MNVKCLNADGSVKEKTVMLGNSHEKELEEKYVGTWIPRHIFNGVLYSHVVEKHADTVKV